MWVCACLLGLQDRSASACGWVNYHTNEGSLAAKVCRRWYFVAVLTVSRCLQADDCVSERRCALLGKMRKALECQAVRAKQSDVIVRDRTDYGSLPVVALQ